jgi:hypothetical protein
LPTRIEADVDYEADFRTAVQETIEAFRQRGVAPEAQTFGETTVVGWTVDRQSLNFDRGEAGRDFFWEEAVEHRSVVLAEDGTFWRCLRRSVESSVGNSDSHSAEPMGASSFVGNRGLPFSEWKEKVLRRPYLN